MNITKAVGLGILIWMVVYAASMLLGVYDMSGALWTQIVAVVIAAVIAYIAGMMVKASSMNAMIKYSVAWVIVTLVLDAVLASFWTMGGYGIFSTWYLWVGYVLILLVPLVAVKKGGGAMPPKMPMGGGQEPPAAPPMGGGGMPGGEQ